MDEGFAVLQISARSPGSAMAKDNAEWVDRMYHAGEREFLSATHDYRSMLDRAAIWTADFGIWPR
ncbi:hypothetical protein [Bradyrhizobium vignae]|uniref:hypothetical protein n=1 Tax=Bradyrhizobium vignae TaxID=1549949 RepID=UPI00100BD411|nr:hypothetical protein [Bradyrhizobium vignae]RXG83964.1 hypothetical protein EAV90_38105 [Bradyrhizobium vignae]